MLESLTLPAGVSLVRTTPPFTPDTVPAGLLSAHRLASGVWGRLRVDAGSVMFVVENTGASRRLEAGDSQVIEPDVAHHVEPGADASFVVELYK